MRFFVLFSALWVVLAACSANPNPTKPSPDGFCDHVYFLSQRFTPDEQMAIERANTRWNNLGVRHDCLTAAENQLHGLRQIAYNGPEWQEISKAHDGANILGLYERAYDRITIVDTLSIPVVELVALHELGHARGLAHTAAPSIMHASIGTATDFTVNDVLECRKTGACVGAPDSAEVYVLEDEESGDCVFVGG